ncbi:polyhomeotic-like protein 3 isoform X2 [Xenopus laevis]|uniref:Polyhomeotic-like protein 3 isoform X2 n=1 Tax=Xenopus laevis TaxID=8355 RepID=A0A8J0VD29_XENLA|nr:polyhomeotic-like protein 3 isoform X2 [Xenopus laevis]
MENEHVITTSSETATTSTSSSANPTPISVYSSSDRHAVQVIQQALNRPTGSAAQYLQQMYSAQQQHLMLQTAALHQQHLNSNPLQTIQQSNVTGERPSVSSVSTTQQSNVSQTSVHLSTSPPPPQMLSRSQTSSTTSSSITQKTVLLGGTSPTLSASQAQMYLRAQMLIFTPAATVAAVQSDIPVISSSSSSSSSCQSAAQNLTIRSQPMLEMSFPNHSPSKPSNQDHPLAICHKTTVASSKTIHADATMENNQKDESSVSDSRCTAVTRTSNLHQLISPVSYSTVHSHSLGKHPAISILPDHPKLPQQVILQQQQQIQHRHQIQTITLHNPALEPPSTQHCVPLQSQNFVHIPSSTHSHHCTPVTTSLSPSPTISHSAQSSVVVSPPLTHSPCQSPTIIIHPQAIIQPQTSLLVPSTLPARDNLHHPLQTTLHAAPQMSLPTHLPPTLSLGPQQQHALVSSGPQLIPPLSQTPQPELQSIAPPTVASSPHLPTTPASQLQALPLQSMQTIPVQPEILTPGQVLMQNTLLTEEDLPAAEALVQLPFQTLPPPQTVAVNLHIQPAPVESPVVYQVQNVCPEEAPVVQKDCVHVITQTPTPPTLSPSDFPVGSGEALPSDPTLQGLPSIASSVSASVIKSPSDTSHMSIPAPPLLLPAATTRSTRTLKPNSIPGLEKLPHAIVKPQILTHVIEGFVIQEGVEPFPVNRSSLLAEKAVKPLSPLDEGNMNIADMESDIQSSAKLPDNSTDTDMEDLTAEEGIDELECELLACEFCGKTGYPNKFLRSKRFCSLSCAKRYNANSTKQLGLFKANKTSRWRRKVEGSLGRRGIPSSSGGSVREHYLRQLPTAYSCANEALEDSHEDSTHVTMTTRLRRQSEREREERKLRQMRKSSCELSPDTQTEPSLWTVEDVWAFIRALPGCREIADEFRTQEIDGQALLLLKEDHLMGTMNIKLGPALKICARINSLKES